MASRKFDVWAKSVLFIEKKRYKCCIILLLCIIVLSRKIFTMSTNIASLTTTIQDQQRSASTFESSVKSSVYSWNRTGDPQELFVDGDLCQQYALGGGVFQGGVSTRIHHDVSTCHLKTFGKEFEEECRQDFVDLENKINVILKSPSLLWHQGDLHVALKVEVYRPPGSRLGCYGYMCNHLYVMRFDKYLNRIGRREMIQMKLPYKHRDRSGPDDSRIFQMNGSLYIMFAAGYAAYNVNSTVTHLISGIWDYQNQKPFFPDFERELVKSGVVMEKNWVPLINNQELFVITNLDPLYIMKCKIHEGCTFMKNNDNGSDDSKILNVRRPLRGGTSFELYKYPYHVSLVHGTYYRQKRDRYYTAHLLVMNAESLRIVYVSDPIKIHQDLYSRYQGDRYFRTVKGDFLFPTGILVENENSLVIGAHINDKGSVLLRLDGIASILQDIMALDKAGNLQNPDFSIQNYILEKGTAFGIPPESLK